MEPTDLRTDLAHSLPGPFGPEVGEGVEHSLVGRRTGREVQKDDDGTASMLGERRQ
jgi:hypothetical protein